MSNDDQSIALMIEQIVHANNDCPADSILWVADEQATTADLSPLASQPIHFLSNRIGPYRSAKQSGFQAEFSDFDFSGLLKAKKQQIKGQHQNPLKWIFFRVAKERPLVHYIINQAFQYLQPGGCLCLIGYKNEGIKTHISRAAKLFGSKPEIKKSKNQLSMALITKDANTGENLDDQQYPALREIDFSDEHRFWSKPGIYGWNKIDQGSQFLCESFSHHHQSESTVFSQIFDLGCGYGYLSAFLSSLNPNRLVATDNCAAALHATAKNLEEQDCAKIVASDAGDNVAESFDLIFCNPPFHQGFSTNSEDLHAKFLTNTKRLMNASGEAWYVVNQFLPLEKHCHRASLKCQEMARNNSFKVFRLTH